MTKILVYGYGNPGRQDDGIGEHFVNLVDEWVEKEKIPEITTDCNYQLNIEDSATIAEYDIVFFVDASVVEDVDNFKLERVEPDNASIEFTMHAVSTSYVVDLCRKIYGKIPKAYVLHIKAYEFELIEKLTSRAKENTDEAFLFFKNFISSKAFLK